MQNIIAKKDYLLLKCKIIIAFIIKIHSFHFVSDFTTFYIMTVNSYNIVR